LGAQLCCAAWNLGSQDGRVRVDGGVWGKTVAEHSQYIEVDLQPSVPGDALDRFADEIFKALLIRTTEERLLGLFSEGKLFGTVHTCIGQEFVGIAVARQLGDRDTLFSNHRGHGHFLAYTENVTGLIGEVMGKSIGVCAGRGGSQHLQQDGFYSNGIQGGIAPVATGLGLGHRLKGKGAISVVYLGDGTLGQGAVYESLNIASVWDLPVLFICENNLFAQSTCQTQTLAGDICQRAEAFGIRSAHSNTWDWPGLFDDLESSVAYIRREQRPLFHRIDTFRLMAHSKGDDNRPESYVDSHRQRDPLVALEKAFGADPRWREMQQRAEREVEQAVSAAEASPFDELTFPQPSPPTPMQWGVRDFKRERIVHATRRALGDALAKDDRVILIGEDIESPYGGAFKATEGLSSEFPGRVRNTPISELAIAGLGNGLSLAGMIPVLEFMFGDFMTLAADQWINHASKFRFMFNGKVSMPVVFRTPMGGKRGYASTHSQSLEKHFLGLPDTQVLCVHHRYSPALLYTELFASIDRPTLVIENKILYGKQCSSEPPAGYELLFSKERFPTARLKPRTQPDLTLVAIGGMSLDAEEAALKLFEQEEIAVDLFMPSQLYPFGIDALRESLEETRRLVVVEEGQGFVSLGSEILAQVAEGLPGLGLACGRVAAAPVPIPAARPLEELCLPGVDDIVNKAMEVMRVSGS
jgi:2-oxoisovalerate dehydrogenase E1 component